VAGVEDQLVVNARPAMGEAPEPMAGADPDDPEANDGWITTKIQASYFIDPDVKGRDIDVTTQNGVVTLTGTVSSETERREAASIAREIDGVVEVREQLRVMPSPERAEAEAEDRDDSEMPLTDAWLTTKIQAKYFADPDVSSLDIDVTTRNRVVTLEGEVESTSEKTLAESIARDTQGVTRVVNRLIVANADRR
jgi:osmotically-inducible protein OsmY